MVNGKLVWKNIENNSILGPGQPEHEHEFTRLEMKGNIALIINALAENKIVYKEKISCNYTDELNHSFSSTITQSHVSISPDNQIFFDHFSLSACDEVVDRLVQFFRPYNDHFGKPRNYGDHDRTNFSNR